MAKDRFSGNSQDYKSFRPQYPPGLFERLSELCAQHTLAWDCACGAGQASVPLATHFDQLVATDLSLSQLCSAAPAANVHYVAGLAERSPLSDHSVDLIVVAQALHWFDISKFFDECDRVLRPGGVLSLLTYNLMQCTTGLDKVIQGFYGQTLAGYWDSERRLVEQAYAGIQLPYPPVQMPNFDMRCQWSQQQLLGYLSTWSAVKVFRQQTGEDPLETLAPLLESAWPNAETISVTWPLTCLVGSKPV